MKKIFFTPEGTIQREVTKEELVRFAEDGDGEAKRQVAKENLLIADTNEKRINVILNHLNLK